MKYLVNEIFASIQGEGWNTGIPMIFVRLQGCSVGCGFCDTQYSTHKFADMLMPAEKAMDTLMGYAEMSEKEVGQHILMNWPNSRWVCLTGGEPAEQQLTDLVAELHVRGLKVALETSGTAPGHLLNHGKFDHITISPKWNKPPKYPYADEYKFLVGAEEDITRIREYLLKYRIKAGSKICLQPVSQSKRATGIAWDACYENNWRLSLQTHKYIGVR